MPLKAGRHRLASETPFKCWLGSFGIFQGIWTSIAKKPYICCDFSRGLDPLWIRACVVILKLRVHIGGCTSVY